MSSRLDWRIAIRESSLDPTAKHVALTIDTYMDHRGFAWPSKSSLADDTSRTVRCVDRAIVRLEDSGYLVVLRSSGRKSNRYCAAIPNPVPTDPINPVPTDGVEDPQPRTQNSQPRTKRQPTPYQTTPEAVKKPSRSRTADRSRDQEQISPDPVVLELLHKLAGHTMPA